VDIGVGIYSNRLDIISPGALPNSMTVENMKAGQRSPHNPLIVGVLQDYGYVEARIMGVGTKVIPLMQQHNQSEPIFEATEDYVKTILSKAQRLLDRENRPSNASLSVGISLWPDRQTPTAPYCRGLLWAAGWPRTDDQTHLFFAAGVQ
jgi:predicted HTH transcriptional regulator